MSIVETLKNKIFGGDKIAASVVAGNAAMREPRKVETVQSVKNLTDEEKKSFAAIVHKLRVTEKSSELQKRNTYTFVVHPEATKQQVKTAVERLYDIRVLGVRMVNIPKKRRMRGRMEGWKHGYRKAMVRVTEGQMIETSG